MSEFIYSIKEIFDAEIGCLKHNDVKDGYYIGPYQRGYKWKSQTANDHIPVLLIDLYEAYLKSKDRNPENQEYYLQYITVKRITLGGRNLFELIDGQQRLTSLTLMYGVLEIIFQKENLTKRDNEYLVTYSRYEENENIFDTITSLLQTDKKEDENIEEQDKYYMLSAARCFNMFFEGVKDNSEDDFDKFCIYLNNNVKLILNKEDETTSSEEIFSNLNSNKVPLTNSYLIKGLLLTKASRNSLTEVTKKHFREILDQRAIMGRTWDEMNSWFSLPQVKRFFFGHEQDGMEQMLKLIRFENNKSKSEVVANFRGKLVVSPLDFSGGYELFNYFHDNLLAPTSASDCLNDIKHIFKRLKSWFEHNSTFNLLGYYLATNKSDIHRLRKLIGIETNQEVISFLKEYLCKQLTFNDLELEALHYGKKAGNDKITNVLLALSVFPKSEWFNDSSNYRFNFYQYDIDNWSLEHIFPQNPNLEEYDVSDDKDWVISKIEEQIANETDLEKINKHQDTITLIKSDQKITTEAISFIFDEIQDVHNLGNMALLSGKVNSALSNGFFNTKRKILVQKVNSGIFVPKHTIDAFSKMIEIKKPLEFNKSLFMWNENDIVAHKSWIIQSVKEIVEQNEAKVLIEEIIL